MNDSFAGAEGGKPLLESTAGAWAVVASAGGRNSDLGDRPTCNIIMGEKRGERDRG